MVDISSWHKKIVKVYIKFNIDTEPSQIIIFGKYKIISVKLFPQASVYHVC